VNANAVNEQGKKQGLCSIPDAAAFLSISRGKLYMMLNAGEIPSKRFGKSVRIPWAWLYAQAEIRDDDAAE
jgi:excisionase family DNA binding protein